MSDRNQGPLSYALTALTALGVFAIYVVFDAVVWQEEYVLPGKYSADPEPVAWALIVGVWSATMLGAIGGVLVHLAGQRTTDTTRRQRFRSELRKDLNSRQAKVAVLSATMSYCVLLTAIDGVPREVQMIAGAFAAGWVGMRLRRVNWRDSFNRKAPPA